MRRLRCGLALALAVPLLASAQTADLSTSVELGGTRESLSNGSPDWQDTGLDLSHQFGPREYLGVSLHDVRRFGLESSSATASYLRPLTEHLAASIEGSVSPGSNFLPRTAIATTLQYEFAPAWLLHGGLRSASYADSHVTQGLLQLERYIPDWSWSVAWKPASALGSFAQSFEVRGNYYYGDRNTVGIILAAGREATSVGPQQVVLADVRSIALLGRHALTDHWALTYALTRVRQGRFYTRTGVHLGVQYRF